MEARAWLVDWFSDHAAVPADSFEAAGGANFIEQGWIDSIQFIKLVGEIEECWALTLANEDLEDPRFFTLDGMAEIIELKARHRSQTGDARRIDDPLL